MTGALTRALLALTMAVASLGLAVPAQAATLSAAQYETRIADLVNQARADAGLSPLLVSTSISATSRAWSQTMAGSGDSYHNPAMKTQMPSGWKAIAENIAYGALSSGQFPAEDLHQALMNSAGHRANIMNPTATHLGVGVALISSGGYNYAYLTENFGTYAPGPLDCVAERTSVRLSGPSREETAIAIGKRAFPTSDEVVLVSGNQRSLVDGLVAAPFAYSRSAPVLISGTTALSAATKAEIQRRSPSVAWVVGGTGVIGSQVVSELTGMGITVTRLSGADRFGTAAAVAAQMPSSSAALVVSGMSANLIDAAAASGAAAATGRPILLTAQASLPTATRSALLDRDTTAVTVVGGTGAVSAAVVSALSGAGMSVNRVAGPDRYSTAVAVASAFAPLAGTAEVVIAAGTDANLIDAMTGGVLGRVAVLTGTTSVPAVTATWVDDKDPGAVLIVGGTGAVGTYSAAVLACR